MYKVFDEETTVKSPHRRKANPFCKDNWIVARGWKNQGQSMCSWQYFKSAEASRSKYLVIEPEITILIGHNIKFDLHYEMMLGNPDLIAFFKRAGKIWDTQYAEYLLNGQTQDSQMVALTDLAPKYGGTPKIDAVKALWEAGVQTEDIPEDLLIDYLVGTEEEQRNGGDIRNTELCFLGQIVRASQQGQIKMIQDRMDGLLCTTEMEYNGLKVDVQEAGQRLRVLSDDLDRADAELNGYIPADLPFEFNWGSKVHVSAFIFGGTVRYEVREPYIDDTGEWARKLEEKTVYVNLNGGYTDEPGPHTAKFVSGSKKGEYKTKKVKVPGELKIKWQDRFYTFSRQTDPNEEWATKVNDGAGVPIYSTGGDVIEELGLRDIPFLKAMANKAKLDKEIGTYYVRYDEKKKEHVGMLTCVQPADHILHHKLNHTSTVTTRLSSSDPNLQNLPRGDKSQVKKMFVSRFGSDGVMIEADYSQLEVVVQGVLSCDTNLCNMLRNKIDFHCLRVSKKFHISYDDAVRFCKDESYEDYKKWKKERTKCKEFSFQRAYGAGAPAIAAATGMDIDEVRQLIVAEDELFPGVGVFNAAVETAVLKSCKPFQSANDNGQWHTYRRGTWQAPTGTLYSFRTYDAPAFLQRKGVRDSFSPPELKNYPVQGTGGEFVQAVLGLLWRQFVSTDNYMGRAYLVNTVHDCVWVDCHRDVVNEVAADMQRIMTSIPEYFNNRYGMNIDVPFPVEVECGPNMYELKHWHEEDYKAS